MTTQNVNPGRGYRSLDPSKPLGSQVEGTGTPTAAAPATPAVIPASSQAIDRIPPSGESKIVLTADFGKLYVRTAKGQIMRPIKADMTLLEKLGHIYKVKGAMGANGDPGKETWSITVDGYVHLNQVSSVSLLTPQTVIVDGRAQPNPYIIRNPRTKAVDVVHIRKLGIGYSPAGNVVVIDKTLYYNIYTYWIQSIQAKMTKADWNSKQLIYPNCAKVGIETDKPDMAGQWAFFPIEPPLGIWANYADPVIAECLSEHVQRQRFGDRIAERIVSRNILKDHPAIGISKVYAKMGSKGVETTVTVYGYRHDMTASDLADIRDQVENGGETQRYEVKAEVITATDPEAEGEALRDLAGEDPAGGGEPAEAGTLFNGGR